MDIFHLWVGKGHCPFLVYIQGGTILWQFVCFLKSCFILVDV